ncbi:Gfo/Idh/MocA family protein [Xanthovirga aplysinae]|uniref:Gfo/Idh/MocA family protein n=1 Tax=Xanthovirga aplysinae TaxID=2529853 RepID=UPI0012BC6367|nr:Gfo/Idh/MocA family oxidoreductase [Xanthovirga aplysinae]MTI31132.1 Gfo/Idh/MocA family oxidoreductase [Xanthovirga aplysinae]
MNKVKFAIVGCGNIGKRHLAVIDADERADVVALCDSNREKVVALSELYGDIPYYLDYRELLEKTDADVISICTPHGLHAPMSIEAANKRKHVLVEKPMALTTKDCQQMIEAAKTNEVQLMVVKQNRFNVPIQLTKDLLDAGKLGKVYMVQCNVMWNRNPEYYSESDWRGKERVEGGALYTQVSHFIDLLIWWFGDVIEADARLDTKLQQVEVEDCGTANVRFSSGVMGSLLWTTCVYNKNYEGSITIIAEKGTIKIGGPYLNKIDFFDVQSFPIPDKSIFIDQPNHYGKYQGTSSNHDKVIGEVIKKLFQEVHQVVEGDEGLKTVEAIEKIYQNQIPFNRE